MAKSKYAPLTSHLKKLGFVEIPMTFAEIEKVVGEKLPPSAFKHRPWWSNNPSNSVITYAWLEAGYKTGSVDMESRRLVFRKVPESELLPVSAPSTPSLGLEEQSRAFDDNASPQAQADVFAALYGAMKNTIKFVKTYDPSEPAFSEEETRAFEEKWDRLLSPARPVDQTA